ncbi:uncharacterized protein DSM5745_11442 [Aspergillus mulundensis]|uniref:Uncharacterized protein n=1 Tax=Aspergillus mulundensis TaxID=1810919 RepID=A0A3D8Q781_9EURO|nr:Uncharacterized protein DSM5745_11442 [Aspergillus mulundensis]RDW57547.1 Uncharacterized protein DSM5745_11442 [Aspergillus mulundensis]
MSFGQGGCNPNEGIDEFYGGINPQWPSPYGAVSNPYNAPPPYQASAILTPISLPDNSYAHTRTSPVLSHHSQEYQYPVSDSVAHHGLGITTPYPSELTRDPHYGLGIAPSGYGIREETLSPQPSQRRARRESRPSVTRDPPVTILPHPEGLQRLEEQQRQSLAGPSIEPARASGRGRRNQQAEEEDAYVYNLRQQKLAWRVIRDMYRERYNKDATEARLQMRQRRRRERMARWDDHDVRILLQARDFWEQEKYKLIAQKMSELGANTTYTAEQCEAQLENIQAQEREREEQEQEDITPQEQPQATEPRRKRRRTEPDELRESTSHQRRSRTQVNTAS